MDVNVEGWLSVLGVFALFVFEVFLIVRAGQAIACKMLDEIEKHPEITALLNALVVALIAAVVGLLAWGIYETTIDAARDSFIPQQKRGF